MAIRTQAVKTYTFGESQVEVDKIEHEDGKTEYEVMFEGEPISEVLDSIPSENFVSRAFGHELAIPLPNNRTLRCGAGSEYDWGGYVRITDSDGNEIIYWDKDEWEEDPESVMGAIFQYAMEGMNV